MARWRLAYGKCANCWLLDCTYSKIGVPAVPTRKATPCPAYLFWSSVRGGAAGLASTRIDALRADPTIFAGAHFDVTYAKTGRRHRADGACTLAARRLQRESTSGWQFRLSAEVRDGDGSFGRRCN